MVAAKSTRRNQRAPARDWVAIIVSATGLLLFAGVIGGSYHYLSQPGRMPLRVVEVQGDFRHLSQAAISDTAGAAIDGGFFTCDMPKLRRAVLAMPWVADVAIRRVWPDRLVMRVTEREPLARWGDDALVSHDARVFRPDNLESYARLPRIHGPAGSEQRVVGFFRTVATHARQRDLQVAAVVLDERRHWWVDFTAGLTLSLGREDRDARLAQFLRVYPQLLTDPMRQPQRVDMRYAHGFAVRWKEGEAAAAPSANSKVQEEV